jgi:hypothetical protein
VFLRRRVLDEVGWLNSDLHLVFDWEYWMRLIMTYEAQAVIYLDEPVAENRIWEGTKTVKGRMDASSDERRRVLEQIFASPALPPAIRPMYTQAIATTYWRQGHLQREARHPWAALRNIRRAHQLAPELYPWNLAWAIQFWLHTYWRFPFWLIPYWAAGRLWRAARRLLTRS